jgi:hypothetical protein
MTTRVTSFHPGRPAQVLTFVSPREKAHLQQASNVLAEIRADIRPHILARRNPLRKAIRRARGMWNVFCSEPEVRRSIGWLVVATVLFVWVVLEVGL